MWCSPFGYPPVVRCKSKSKSRDMIEMYIYYHLRRSQLRRTIGRSPNALRPDFSLAIVVFLGTYHDPVTSAPVPVHEQWIRDVRCESSHLLHVRSGIMYRCGSAILSTSPSHRSQILSQSPARSQHPRDWDKKSTKDQLRVRARFFPLNPHGHADASLNQSDKRRETQHGGRGP